MLAKNDVMKTHTKQAKNANIDCWSLIIIDELMRLPVQH